MSRRLLLLLLLLFVSLSVAPPLLTKGKQQQQWKQIISGFYATFLYFTLVRLVAWLGWVVRVLRRWWWWGGVCACCLACLLVVPCFGVSICWLLLTGWVIYLLFASDTDTFSVGEREWAWVILRGRTREFPLKRGEFIVCFSQIELICEYCFAVCVCVLLVECLAASQPVSRGLV